MSTILRQSTSRVVRIGPALAVGDGFTPVTTLDLSTADEAELLKAAGAATVDISGATFAAVTGADAWYDLTLTASHTDTVGDVTVVINDDSLILPIYKTFTVVEEAIYDALYASGATGLLPANVTQISGDSTAADNAESFFDGTGYGVHPLRATIASINSQTSINLSVGAETDNAYQGYTIIISDATSGEGGGAARTTRTVASSVWDAAVTTLVLDSTPGFTIGAGDTVELLPPGFAQADRTNLNDIETNVGAAGAGLTSIPWNAAWDTEVQSEVQDAIEANHLDHFIAVADPTGIVANNSLLAKLVSSSATAAFGDYANTTDSLQALRDNHPSNFVSLGIDATGYVLGLQGTIHDFDALIADGDDFGAAMDTQGYTAARAANLDNINNSIGGAGADQVTVSWTNSDTGLAVADGDVWITSDAAGTTVVAGTQQTNANGETTFLLDGGSTYFLWAQRDGVHSIRGQEFVAVAD